MEENVFPKEPEEGGHLPAAQADEDGRFSSEEGKARGGREKSGQEERPGGTADAGLSRMLQTPDTDELLPLFRVGKKSVQKGVKAGAVIHDPEVTELMT